MSYIWDATVAAVRSRVPDQRSFLCDMSGPIIDTRISTLWEAEQHVYGIPAAGTMPSIEWTRLTTDRRVVMRSRAIEIWKRYLENDGRVLPHPSLWVPELRQMLSHTGGELIVEEL